MEIFCNLWWKFTPCSPSPRIKDMARSNNKMCFEIMLILWGLFCLLQAYTSQFVALIMFALLMCDDRISVQPRRREIIQGLKVLPGKYI